MSATAWSELHDAAQPLRQLLNTDDEAAAPAPWSRFEDYSTSYDAYSPQDSGATLEGDITVPAAEITIVTTARELQAALEAGARDIQIEAHLDLSALPLTIRQPDPTAALTALPVSTGLTRSVRGNCASPPPSPGALGLQSSRAFDWRAPQCVIVADHDPFEFSGQVWVDALLLWPRQNVEGWSPVFAFVVQEDAALYVTRTTIQGSGLADSDGNMRVNTTAVYAYEGARVYMDGCYFNSIGGAFPLLSANNASIVVARSSFGNIRKSQSALSKFTTFGTGPTLYWGDALFVANGPSASAAALDSTFSNTTTVAGDMFWTVDDGIAVADNLTAAGDPSGVAVDPEAVFNYEDGESGRAEGLSVLEDLPSSRVTPPTAEDPWFVATQEAIAEAGSADITASPEPPPNPPPPTPPTVPASAPPEIAAVYTPEQLQLAFHTGVRDIEIRAHLDLRDLPNEDFPIAERGAGLYQLGWVGRRTRSIRGKCADPPPQGFLPPDIAGAFRAADEEPWAAPRCVLVSTLRVFLIGRPSLWLDSLHIKIPTDADQDYDEDAVVPVAVIAENGGSAYLTNMVVDADRRGPAVGLWTYRSPGFFVQDSVLAGLRGDDTRPFAVLVSHSTARFQSCVFRTLGTPLGLEATDVRVQDDISGTLATSGLNTTLVLQNSTLANMQSGWPISTTQGASVFSDNPAQTSIFIDDRTVSPPRPLAELQGRAARWPAPLQGDDPWFVEVQQVLASPPLSLYLEEFPLADNATAAVPMLAPLEAPQPSPVSTPTAPQTAAPPDKVPGDSAPATSNAPGPGDPGTDIGTALQPGGPPDADSAQPGAGTRGTGQTANGTRGAGGGPASGESEDELGTIKVVGISVAAAASVLLVAACAVFVLVKRKKKKKGAATQSGAASTQAGAAAQAANGAGHASAHPEQKSGLGGAGKPPSVPASAPALNKPYPPSAPGPLHHPGNYYGPYPGQAFPPNVYAHHAQMHPPPYGPPHPAAAPYMHGGSGAPQAIPPPGGQPQPPSAGFWLPPPFPHPGAGAPPGAPQHAWGSGAAPHAYGAPQHDVGYMHGHRGGSTGTDGDSAVGRGSLAAESASDVTRNPQ